MKLHEVLRLPEVQSGELWFRPVDWQYVPQAFVVQDGMVFTVPTSRGGHPGITAYVDLLAGVWEAVSADVVLKVMEESK